MSATPRYIPDRPLPPYTYVPGRSPHPIRDPAGHSFAQSPETPDALTAPTWRDNRAYLYGIDLFNNGFFWEAHVTWELLWHRAGRKGPTADFLKALIQLAAAGVKHLQDTPRGVASHGRRAAELFRALPAESDFLFGLNVKELTTLADTISRDGWPERTVLLELNADG
jgi:hypothetical protein